MLRPLLLSQVTAYASTGLIIATGCCFAILCLTILFIELSAKMIAVPLIFSFGLVSLTYGFIKRKLFALFKK